MTISKTCTKCNETKTLDAFNTHSGGKYGKAPQCKACLKLSRASTKERDLTRAKVWRDNNPSKTQECTLRWRKDNPVRYASQLGKDKAKARNPDCIPEHFNFEATLPLYAERIRLTQETGVEHHVDHIVAIEFGGLHTASNLQVLTAEDNIRKRDHDRANRSDT